MTDPDRPRRDEAPASGDTESPDSDLEEEFDDRFEEDLRAELIDDGVIDE